MKLCYLCHQPITPGQPAVGGSMHATCVNEEVTGRPAFEPAPLPRGLYQTVSTPSRPVGGVREQVRWALAYIKGRYDETYPPGSPERERHRRVTRGEPE